MRDKKLTKKSILEVLGTLMGGGIKGVKLQRQEPTTKTRRLRASDWD